MLYISQKSYSTASSNIGILSTMPTKHRAPRKRKRKGSTINLPHKHQKQTSISSAVGVERAVQSSLSTRNGVVEIGEHLLSSSVRVEDTDVGTNNSTKLVVYTGKFNLFWYVYFKIVICWWLGMKRKLYVAMDLAAVLPYLSISETEVRLGV